MSPSTRLRRGTGSSDEAQAGVAADFDDFALSQEAAAHQFVDPRLEFLLDLGG
jgi:hypothetical protein